MTTTVMSEQHTAPPRDPLRLVAIRADLLPAEVVAGRHARRARRWVLTGLVLLLAVMGGWYGLTVLQSGLAYQELTSAQDETAALTRQQREYADLLGVKGQSALVNDELDRLFAGDVRWPQVLTSLRAAAPGGVRLTSLSAKAEQTAAGDAATGDAETRLPSTADAGLIGSIEISGVAGTKPQIAAYVDALAGADGVADPYLDSAIEHEDGFLFTVRLDLTADALGGRYTDSGGN